MESTGIRNGLLSKRKYFNFGGGGPVHPLSPSTRNIKSAFIHNTVIAHCKSTKVELNLLNLTEV